MTYQTLLEFATGLALPVGEGRLLLGAWQGSYLWEHRTSPHRRRVVVTVMGGTT